MLVRSVDHPQASPLQMPERFRLEVVYFMTPAGSAGVPALAANEYFIRREDAEIWLEDMVFRVVSPLDAEAKAEIELSDNQEAFLEWLIQNDTQHIRLG